MTYFRSEIHGVRCDGEECENKEREEVNDIEQNTLEAEDRFFADLEDKGWTSTHELADDKHFCPDCSAKLKASGVTVIGISMPHPTAE